MALLTLTKSDWSTCGHCHEPITGDSYPSFDLSCWLDERCMKKDKRLPRP